MIAGQRLKIVIQSDDIASFVIAGDSSFALLLAAQQRGYEIWHYHPNDIFWDRGEVYANCRTIRVTDRATGWVEYGQTSRLVLADHFDVILMRQDPPFDLHYISICHLLNEIGSRVKIINQPLAVIAAPEKLSPLRFLKFMPQTAIAFTKQQLDSLVDSMDAVIIKPLFGNGGEGIMRIDRGDVNRNSIIETLLRAYPRQPLMVQEFLPEIASGDKRIILLDGEFVGAINRLPSPGESRANLHVGGTAELAQLTTVERQICSEIAPWLRQQGLYFCGIDVIDDRLTEINVTSPTGIREIKRLGGPDIAELFWHRLANN